MINFEVRFFWGKYLGVSLLIALTKVKMIVSTGLLLMGRAGHRQIIAGVVLLTIVWVNGIHVFAQQAVAWTKMYEEYSTVMSASDALDFTISGKDLCGICLAAEDLRVDMEEMLEDYMASGQMTLVLTSIVDGFEVFKESQVVHRIDLISERRLIGFVESLNSPPPRGLFA